MNTRPSPALLAALIVTCLIAPAPSGAQEAKGSLRITITGIESDDGSINVALVNSEDLFLSKTEAPFRSAIAMIENQTVEVVFGELPHGDYTISVFHDENDNGELDSGFMGRPKEPYGFSNDARGKLGPPSYDDAVFSLDIDDLSLEIMVK